MRKWLIFTSFCLFYISCISWQDKDLYIPEIFVNARQEVYLIIKNQGHTPIDESNIDLEVYWDRLLPITFNLDSLDPHFRKPGDSSIIKLPFNPGTKPHIVSARINTKNAVQETDEDHNVYLRTISSDSIPQSLIFNYPTPTHQFDEAVYDNLIDHSVMTDQVIWYEGKHPYVLKYWQAAWKDRLKLEIQDIYNGVAVSYPDTLTSEFSREQAFDIFLRYVAHSLYIEQEHLVPWSVNEFAPGDYNTLWDARSYFDWDSLQHTYHYDYQAGGAVRVFHPLISYLAARSVLTGSATQLDKALSDLFGFIRGYFNHTERSGLIFYQDVRSTWFPQPGQQHTVFSCWATGGMILEFCRAMNMPVRRADIELYNGLHTQLHFPTLGWHLTHADDLYDPMFYPIHKQVPSTEVLMNENEYYSFQKNHPICILDSCHTRRTQNTYDRRRWMVQKAASHGSNGLGTGFLSLKLDESQLAFKSYLSGDEFPDILAPLFSVEEQKRINQSLLCPRSDIKMMKERYQRYLACKNNTR